MKGMKGIPIVGMLGSLTLLAASVLSLINLIADREIVTGWITLPLYLISLVSHIFQMLRLGALRREEGKKLTARSTYFSVSGDADPAYLVERIGVRPDRIVKAGERLPDGSTAERTVLFYGIDNHVGSELHDRLFHSIEALIPIPERLAELRAELHLRYGLALGGREKSERLLILPSAISTFVNLSDAVHDLDYHIF